MQILEIGSGGFDGLVCVIVGIVSQLHSFSKSILKSLKKKIELVKC